MTRPRVPTGAILDNMSKNGWAADNLVFGSGGALLQKLNRDTQKCAFKCCSITINGVEREVFKDPITDPGKKSKKGKLTLQKIVYPDDQATLEAMGVFGAHDPTLVGTEQIATICEAKVGFGVVARCHRIATVSTFYHIY